MVGFVGLSLAILLALSLLSYSPHDASFNVSAPSPGGAPARNWIGPVGAHMADAFFQFCGFSAFLFPIGMFVVAMRWFRSQLLEAPVTKMVGATMLLASLSSELALIHMPEVRGALPAGGLLGSALADGLRAGFNPLGANLVSIVTFLTALFLTTSFSFRTAGQWMKKPMTADGYFGQLMARAREWRESDRLRKRVEEIKIAGRPAVAQQRVSTKEAVVEKDEEEEDEHEEKEAPTLLSRIPTIIKFRDDEPSPPKKKPAASEPKIAHGRTNYKLPPPSLLTPAERGEKMDESELKERARAIEAKCLEFGIGGHITQINPGPVVTTMRSI